MQDSLLQGGWTTAGLGQVCRGQTSTAALQGPRLEETSKIEESYVRRAVRQGTDLIVLRLEDGGQGRETDSQSTVEFLHLDTSLNANKIKHLKKKARKRYSSTWCA